MARAARDDMLDEGRSAAHDIAGLSQFLFFEGDAFANVEPRRARPMRTPAMAEKRLVEMDVAVDQSGPSEATRRPDL
jgi:hypothetical protein